MLILPYVDHPDDEPFWISKAVFATYFDQDDLVKMRHVERVSSTYRPEWFPLVDGARRFQLPIVSFVSGRTQFINGRHRTAVLLDYLEDLPFALVASHLGQLEQRLRAAIPKRALELSRPIQLPDLPFLDPDPTQSVGNTARALISSHNRIADRSH